MRLNLKMLFKRRPKPEAAAAKKQPSKTVFTNEMVLESIQIEKKDAVNYIRGRATTVFETDNFYYAYCYQNGVLNFVAAHSDTHLSGKLTVFTPALLKNGTYYFLHEDKSLYYVVTHAANEQNDEKRLHLVISPQRPDNAVNLADIEVFRALGKIPDTLKFRWSQQTTSLNAMLLVVPLFLSSLAGWGYYLYQQKALPNPKAAQRQANIDITKKIIEVGNIVDRAGVITKVISDGKTMTFNIKFENDVEQRKFLTQFGGSLDANAEVVFTAPVPGGH